MKKRLSLWILFCGLSSAFSATVPVLRVADSINPGTGDYLIAGIEQAEREKAPYVLIILDTPGGLLTTTRAIVQKMLNSDVPIVVYVGPRGAHAGSAGALITLAADVAAMAPATNIGAAHPVSGGGEKPDPVMTAKLTNDTAAFAESVAKTRGRNTEWAIKAVRDSVSVIAEEALKQGIIDLMAEDTAALQGKLSGFRFKTAKRNLTHLPTAAVEFTETPMSLRHRLVSFFADPNLAYLIMSLGALCLWVELSHPGLIIPGVVGALCIIVSLVSFQLLPISYGALALIFLGLGFMVAELFLPTFGILGIAGVLSFVFGSLFLMDTTAPEFQISLKLILPTAAVLTGALIFLGAAVMRSLRNKNLSGLEALVGEYGEAREAISAEDGKVFIQGELWNAKNAEEGIIPKGALVVVKHVQQMKLIVAEKT